MPQVYMFLVDALYKRQWHIEARRRTYSSINRVTISLSNNV